MKLSTLKTERLLLLAILAMVAASLLSGRCSPSNGSQEPVVTIVRDTVWQTKVDTFTVQTTRYETVFVHREVPTEIITNISEVEDPTTLTEARVYRDTLSNDDIDIYSYDLLTGELLDSEISYKLKVPREITVTKTIEYPKTYRSGVYLFGELGGNTQRFDNISLGLQYNRKGNWFAGYRVNLNAPQGTTHNLSVGIRLFK